MQFFKNKTKITTHYIVIKVMNWSTQDLIILHDYTKTPL